MSVSERTGKGRNILLLMSGSIACAKASALISGWTVEGHRVRVACTCSVAGFVGAATINGLGAEMVFDDVFADEQTMEHISLGIWADIIIAAPATSNLINKLSAGIADDAVTTVWQAAYGLGKPMLIVPAMNTRMWRYPATQESVARLEQWGIHVLPVASGKLACGEQGEGRMPEPAEIMRMVDKLLDFDQHEKLRGGSKSELKNFRPAGKRVLVTAGGTQEPIDSVRYIGNISSGRTAARLSDALSRAGHAVTWLGAREAVRPGNVGRIETFFTFSDLQSALQLLLESQEYDVIIHAAAVGDFSVERIESSETVAGGAHSGKLSSQAGLVLHMKPNPKLLVDLKKWSVNPQLIVIGFKLTDSSDPAVHLSAVQKQFRQADVDAVVHNDLTEMSKSAHPFSLHARAGKAVHCVDNQALAVSINQLIGVL